MSRMHTREYSSIRSNGLALLPTLLLIAGVFAISLYRDSLWLPIVIAAAFLLSILIASLLLAPPGPYIRAAGMGATILLTSSIFLLELLTLYRHLDWIATSEPALFLFSSGIVLSTTQPQRPQKYGAGWLAIILYIVMIYLADVSGNWWLPAIISIATFLPLAISLLLIRERNNQQRTILKVTAQLTALAILASLVLGFVAFMSQHGIWQGRHGTGSAWVLGLTAMVCATRQILRTRLILWSVASYPAAAFLLINTILTPTSWLQTILTLLLLPMLAIAHVLANRLPRPRRRLLELFR
ncbi:MAG TPA: hypothetical protein VL485_11240 [Ktedonobacteraceae bacterium]|nr:hypothetical protein [Ktedonobacteraceae bacterium]